MNPNRLFQLLEFQKEIPDDPFTLFALAKEYENLQDLQNAIAYYEQLLIKAPKYVGTYYHYGKLKEKQLDKKGAIALYEQGISLAIAQKEQRQHLELRAALDDLLIE